MLGDRAIEGVAREGAAVRTVVTILVALVMAGIGWFWWRADTIDDAPVVRAAPQTPLPVVTGQYVRVSGECADAVSWESVHARPWQALSQQFGGAVETCVDVYRDLREQDDAGDYYLAIVTSTFGTASREDSWWPWEGRDDVPDPIQIELTLGAPAVDNVYAASPLALDACSGVVPATSVLLDDARDALDAASVLAGTCRGEVAGPAADADGATWVLERPEEWDLAVVTFAFKTGEGATPAAAIDVRRVGVEG